MAVKPKTFLAQVAVQGVLYEGRLPTWAQFIRADMQVTVGDAIVVTEVAMVCTKPHARPKRVVMTRVQPAGSASAAK